MSQPATSVAAYPAASAATGVPDLPRKPRRKWGDLVFAGMARGFAFLALALLAGIIIALAVASWPSIKAFGGDFLFSPEWNPPAER